MKPRLLLFVLLILLLPALCLAAPKKKATTKSSDRRISVPFKVSSGDGRRVALVIGNSDYKHTGRLSNPVNDARLMAETLQEVGFELYGGKAQLNLTRDDMLTAIETFGDRINRGDTALIFYAGHGMQVKGENYLIPVNANIKNEAEARVKSVETALIFAKLEGAKNGVNIVILDACRNNPFGRSFRSANNGLAQVSAPSGTIVAFSTAPNQVAEDGSGGNSTYTRELARFIKAPGLRIEDVFKRVRVTVEDSTNGSQQPWENTSLKGDFSFVEGGADLADRRVREAEERARKAEEKARRAEQQAAEVQQQPRQQVAMAPRPQAPPPRPVFTDPTTGMEFVQVPKGFSPGKYEVVQEIFILPVPAYAELFSIGKYEVTQGQWKKVMGSNPSHFSSCGDNCPVEDVWEKDAQQFISKLNSMSGKNYRLPTKAEWEYACRAGENHEYCGSNDINAVAWYKGNSGRQTHPVGQKQANAWGIHDMSGNVWEMVQDRIYIGLLRGGSSDNTPERVRAAYQDLTGGRAREGAEPVGFRLVLSSQ